MPLINPRLGVELLQYQGGLLPCNADMSRGAYDDFLYAALAGNYVSSWTNNLSGAGALVSVGASVVDHPGIIQLSTGTTAAGAASVTSSFVTEQFILCSGVWEWREMVRLPTLSDGVESYTVRAGLSDAILAGTPTDGVYFEYGFGVSTGWQAVAANGGTRTTVAAPGVATTDWTELKIRSRIGAVDFYVNDALTQTITTNIPTAGTQYGPGQIFKSAGTTARTMLVDYFFFGYSFGVAR